jgi:hypothetical protein
MRTTSGLASQRLEYSADPSQLQRVDGILQLTDGTGEYL